MFISAFLGFLVSVVHCDSSETKVRTVSFDILNFRTMISTSVRVNSRCLCRSVLLDSRSTGGVTPGAAGFYRS